MGTLQPVDTTGVARRQARTLFRYASVACAAGLRCSWQSASRSPRPDSHSWWPCWSAVHQKDCQLKGFEEQGIMLGISCYCKHNNRKFKFECTAGLQQQQ